MPITNEIIEVNGMRWKIRQAISREKALDAIAFARCSGSVGTSLILDESFCGGGKTVEADVVQVNSDDTERAPYTTTY